MATRQGKKSTKSKPKWSREKCGRYYIESEDDVTIRDIAGMCRWNERTLEKWSSEDQWIKQRAEYRQQLAAAHRANAVQVVESGISKLNRTRALEEQFDSGITHSTEHLESLYSELGAIAMALYQVHRKEMSISSAILTIMGRELEAIQRLPQDQQIWAMKKRIDLRDLNNASQSLNRSTAAIASITGLPYYVNTNIALRKAKAEGWELIPPRGNGDDDTVLNEMVADVRSHE